MLKVHCIKQLMSVQDGLSFPSSLAYNEKTRQLYLCNMNEKCIMEVNLDSRECRILTRSTGNSGQTLRKPLALTIDGHGHLLLTDANDNCLYRLENNIWKKIVFQGDYQMNLPGSVAADKRNIIYVSDFLNQCIIKIEQDYPVEVIAQIPCKKPYGICICGDFLYTACEESANIQKMNLKNGENEVLISGYHPIAVTGDQAGNVYFTETRKLYVVEVNSSKAQLLIEKEIWKETGFPKLAHLGAVTAIEKKRLILSDTIRNSLYEVMIGEVARL